MDPKGRIVYRLSNQLHHSYINAQENDVSDLLIEELRQNEKVVDPLHTYGLPAIEHSQRLPVGLESDTATRTQNRRHTADCNKTSKAASSFALRHVALSAAANVLS